MRAHGQDLNKLSKINIRRLAGDSAAASTSNGQRIDPDAFARRLWTETRRCVLCRKPSYVFGLYLPDGNADPVVRTCLAPHQARFLFYGLCVKGFQHEGVSSASRRRQPTPSSRRPTPERPWTPPGLATRTRVRPRAAGGSPSRGGEIRREPRALIGLNIVRENGDDGWHNSRMEQEHVSRKARGARMSPSPPASSFGWRRAPSLDWRTAFDRPSALWSQRKECR